MRSLRRRRGRRALSEINVVPYIDVMLVLLVIFMITAPLLTQGVNVKLPQAKAKAIATRKQVSMIVTVDKEGRYYVNVSPTPSVPLTSEQLVTLVAAEEQVAKESNKTRPVYVKGDTQATYGEVVKVMSFLQKAGVSGVGLLTQNPKQVTDAQES